MDTIIGFFSGTSIGYFLGKIFGGPQTGYPGVIDSFILSLGNWQLHLHHWFLSVFVMLLFFLFLKRKYTFKEIIRFRLRTKFLSLFFAFSLGFMSGLIFQGIASYEDWHQIIIN